MIATAGLVGLLAVTLLVVRPWIGATQSGAGASTEPSASASATIVASTPASPPAPAFPSGGEVALVALIPEADRDRCAQASPEDTPELREVVRAGVPPVTYVSKRLIAVTAGIECALGGITAPDSVWYWDLRDGSEAVQWIAQQAGAIDAQSGTCSTATPAVEPWEFGGTAGRLLCYTSETGDAILVWNYDGSSLMGRAVRDDQDMAELLRWWSEEARFVSP
jgi:hypothetical protein